MLHYICRLIGLNPIINEVYIRSICGDNVQPSKIWLASKDDICEGYAFVEFSSREKLLTGMKILAEYLPETRIEEYIA